MDLVQSGSNNNITQSSFIIIIIITNNSFFSLFFFYPSLYFRQLTHFADRLPKKNHREYSVTIEDRKRRWLVVVVVVPILVNILEQQQATFSWSRAFPQTKLPLFQVYILPSFLPAFFVFHA
jgi:hypothetical protein